MSITSTLRAHADSACAILDHGGQPNRRALYRWALAMRDAATQIDADTARIDELESRLAELEAQATRDIPCGRCDGERTEAISDAIPCLDCGGSGVESTR